jgi:very-short-patch-repair endonuclease
MKSKCVDNGRFRKGHTPWNKGTKGVMEAWNKGLTKTDERVKKNIESFTENSFQKGHTPWNKGLTKETDERVDRLANQKLGDKNPAKRLIVREKIRRKVLKNYEEQPELLDKIGQGVLDNYREHPEVLETRKQTARYAQPENYTTLEQTMVGGLQIHGIPYYHNYRIGRYSVDFLLEGSNIVVECDGVRHFFDGDTKRDKYLSDRGYIILHFKGCDIDNKLDECMNTIMNIWEANQKR